MSPLSKITLGTVQLGLDYGIANSHGKPDFATAKKILRNAYLQKINTFDTAISYGDSEKIIGAWIKEDHPSVNLITKIPHLPDATDPSTVEQVIVSHIENSLARLNVKKVWGLFFHSVDTIKQFPEIINSILQTIKKNNFCEHIGVSVYSPQDISDVLQFNDIDIIQAPVNVFDHRFLSPKIVSLFQNRERIFFARSVFLQGLFYLEPQQAELKVPGSGIYLTRLNELAKTVGLQTHELALQFVLSHSFIQSVVVGLETETQLDENVKIVNKESLNETIVCKIKKVLADVPQNVFDPRTWQTSKK